tara:strand:- start:1078 stop:1437 length:360 start_codon:yes stop_codon:yes gene_type:complete
MNKALKFALYAGLSYLCSASALGKTDVKTEMRSDLESFVWNVPERESVKAIDETPYDPLGYPMHFKEKKKKGLLSHIYIKTNIDIANFESEKYNWDYITDLDIDDLDMDKWYYGLKWKF